MAVPNATKQQLFQSSIDYENDVIRVALGDDSTAFTFDPSTHSTVADVFDGGATASEMDGTGYSRQGLSNLVTTINGTADRAEWTADDVTWSGLDSGTIQFILVYKQIGGDDTTPGDDPIIAVFDDDSGTTVADLPLVTNGSDVTIQWDTDGIKTIS